MATSIGRNSGSNLFGHIAENTHHMVVISSVSPPVRIFSRASRWFFIGALVDNHLHRAVAFVNRARPACYQSGSQPIKADRTKMPLLDLVTDDRAAIAMGRQGSEFAGAAIGTIAVR